MMIYHDILGCIFFFAFNVQCGSDCSGTGHSSQDKHSHLENIAILGVALGSYQFIIHLRICLTYNRDNDEP